jgi:hypothetical protein
VEHRDWEVVDEVAGYLGTVPVVPNNGKLYIELSSEAAVAQLVSAARALDPEKVARYGTADSLIASDIGDHLMFLAATHPEWFAAYRDAATSLASQLPMDLATAAVLLPGVSSGSIDHLCERLAAKPNDWVTMSLLAAARDERGLDELANIVRRAGTEQWTNRLGVHVGETGPAVWRFTPARHAIVAGSPEDGSEPDGFIGSSLDEVAGDSAGAISWHYLSLRTQKIEGVPKWPRGPIHIVSPRTYWFTLHCEVDARGRYIDAVVDDEGEPYDEGLRSIEADPPAPTTAFLHRYDADLVYRNGHVYLSPSVVGDAGGPPVGLYPNPTCPACGILMFHVATILSHIREYGEGFRSAFICESCIRAAVTGTNWN